MQVTDNQKKVALAMVTVGLGRESASRYVGLPSDGIDQIVLEDDEFAEALCKAEQEAEVYYVQKVRDAARSKETWRAAAWWLERTKPERYGTGKYKEFSAENIERIFRKFMGVLREEVSDKERLRRISDRFLVILHNESKKSGIFE